MRDRPTGRRRLARSTAGVAAVLVALLAAGCRGGDPDPGSTGPVLGLVEPGALTACVSAPHPPFTTLDPAAAAGLGGLDPELLREVAAGLGLELQLRRVPDVRTWERPALGQCDLAAGGLSADPSWGDRAEPSAAYASNPLVLLVSADAEEVDGLDDLEGGTVAVQAGSAADAAVRSRLPAADVASLADPVAAVADLRSGAVDGVVADRALLGPIAAVAADLVVIGTVADGDDVVLALDPARPALVAAVDEQLGRLADDGTLDGLDDRWLGPLG
ncbi:MAG: transporter substrate-binding domain-containing protein [Acidimicrobiales bacterium]|nr:transporter substrate-binding domain-containing protein [Acidimicrobiales bacterium]